MTTPDRMILPVTEMPTIFNKEMAIGAVAGSLFPVVGTFLGGLIGGVFGKQRMNQELQTGRIMDPPSYWNKELLIGSVIGGPAAAAMASTAVLAYSLAGGFAAYSAVGLAGVLGGSLLGIGAIGLAGIVAGAMIGSRMGYKQDAADYERCLQIRELEAAAGMAPRQPLRQPLLEQAPALDAASNTKTTPVGYKNSVTPEESNLLTERQQEKGKQADHAAAYLQQAEASSALPAIRS